MLSGQAGRWVYCGLGIILAAGILAGILLSSVVAGQEKSGDDSETLLARARRLLGEVPLIDGHNDVPWQYWVRARNHLDRIDLAADTSRLSPPMHTDIRRLREGQVGGQFWAVYIHKTSAGPGATRAALDQLDIARRIIDRYSGDLELALSADDIVRIHAAGKVASLLGLEGGHAIENSLGVLRQMHALGIRYMTLTHGATIDWADSATDVPLRNGLTPFGRLVVGEMNRLGMMVDISHVSPKTMHDVLDITEAPVLFSHSSARALNDHPRNVPDDVLRRVKDNGGVVMVAFVPYFATREASLYNAQLAGERARLERLLPYDAAGRERELKSWIERHPEPLPTLAQVVDHIDHIRKIAGIDHIGLGSDFDGLVTGPVGLEDVSKYPHLIAELLRRGYSDEDARKVAGLNLLRVMRENERRGREIRKTRPPADVLIEEIDPRR
ncbi:MAG: dipeptidase [Blastocatellales bacterium]|nr:dipeptidase [Blastocatellales bacterium]